jgi:hypothetical protein
LFGFRQKIGPFFSIYVWQLKTNVYTLYDRNIELFQLIQKVFYKSINVT